MLRAERRDRYRIYLDILSMIEDERRASGVAKVTRVQYKVNVPFDRFKQYLSELHEVGMVNVTDSLKVTAKGREFLVEYSKVLDLIGCH